MRPPLAPIACSALSTMFSSACWSSSGSPLTRGSASECRRTTSMFGRAKRRRAQREHARERGVEAGAPAHEAPRPGEDQQVAHDLRGAIGLAIDPLHVAAQRLRKRARRAQQLEMSEHALQRVVQLVRDARHELAERRELLRLHEPVAQLGALGLELGLRRHVARHQHDADRFALFADERRQRHEKRAAQFRVLDLGGDDLGVRPRIIRGGANQLRSSPGPTTSASGRSINSCRVMPTRSRNATFM